MGICRGRAAFIFFNVVWMRLGLVPIPRIIYTVFSCFIMH